MQAGLTVHAMTRSKRAALARSQRPHAGGESEGGREIAHRDPFWPCFRAIRPDSVCVGGPVRAGRGAGARGSRTGERAMARARGGRPFGASRCGPKCGERGAAPDRPSPAVARGGGLRSAPCSRLHVHSGRSVQVHRMPSADICVRAETGGVGGGEAWPFNSAPDHMIGRHDMLDTVPR